MKLTVIMPTYNEERNIKESLEELVSYFREKDWEFEVLVSDDGSTDDTFQKVTDFIGKNSEVKILKNTHKGKGHAIYQGVMHSRGQYLLFCDADLATPIEEFEKLWEKIVKGDDIVLASREGKKARRLDEPLRRHLMGRAFNYIVRFLTVKGIQDTQCGFKLLRKTAADNIFAKMRLYGNKAQEIVVPAVTAYDVEMLFIAQKLGYRISEASVVWQYQETIRVSALRDSIRNFLDVVRVRWNNYRGYYD